MEDFLHLTINIILRGNRLVKKGSGCYARRRRFTRIRYRMESILPKQGLAALISGNYRVYYPNLFECARYFNERDLFNRAVRMAEWEVDIQMENGAVRGGVINKDEPIPSVFCTGQVIFGWVHAYKETGEDNFLSAAKKAVISS